MQDILDTAVRAAQAGGAVLARFRQQQMLLRARSKPDGSIVTQADKAASEVVRDIILKGDPRAFILDEEEELGHYRMRPDQMWVVDPLDGTSSYIRGEDHFWTMVARVSHGIPIVGAIYSPSTKTTYFGGDRLGVFVQVEDRPPIPLTPRRIMRLDQARLTGHATARPLYDRIARALNVKESLIHEPSGGMYAAVLDNKADIVITRRGRPSVWDVAAGHALLRGMGGEMVDLRGYPINYQEHTTLIHGSLAVVDKGLIPVILTQLLPYDELI